MDPVVQAIVTLYVLVDPIGRAIFFRMLTEHEPEKRPRLVITLMLVVGITLGVSALAGKEILDFMGIQLSAFQVVGGIVLSLMGFEMLLGGEPSRAQGGAEAHEPPSAEDSIVVPYAIPFMCGPGAITAVITISGSTEDGEGTVAALIAVAVVVLLIPVGHLLLVNRLNFSDRTMNIVTKFGGLLVATIGVQLGLTGIQEFFTG